MAARLTSATFSSKTMKHNNFLKVQLNKMSLRDQVKVYRDTIVDARCARNWSSHIDGARRARGLPNRRLIHANRANQPRIQQGDAKQKTRFCSSPFTHYPYVTRCDKQRKESDMRTRNARSQKANEKKALTGSERFPVRNYAKG